LGEDTINGFSKGFNKGYMAVLNKAAFEALYGTSGTVFPDNTTGEISEGDMRQFGKDIADSLFNPPIGLVSYTVVEIGDWNMDSTFDVSVNHGLADHKKIRSINVIIRDDADTNYYNLNAALSSGSAPSGVSGQVGIVSSTTIQLTRTSSANDGWFDSTAFDSTSYNRGWITIGYVA
jgi:hypothetical protein